VITLFRNGQNEGPFSLDQVKAQIKGGVLSLNDPAWIDAWSDWKTVADLPGLLETIPPPAASVPAVHQKPKIDRSGSWCPHCGNRNSFRKTDGVGCLIMGILFISVLGILFIPFLPKSWHCRSCGNVWK
jgi:rubredoxin